MQQSGRSPDQPEGINSDGIGNLDVAGRNNSTVIQSPGSSIMRVTNSIRIRTRRFLVVLGVFFGLAIASAGARAEGGGNVLPPSAKPHGSTLADLALTIALFNTSGNNLSYHPNTPFQVRFVSATNEFFVAPGTPIYVPVFFADDSPPIVGAFSQEYETGPGVLVRSEPARCQGHRGDRGR
jgi:hypothetical protein